MAHVYLNQSDIESFRAYRSRKQELRYNAEHRNASSNDRRIVRLDKSIREFADLGKSNRMATLLFITGQGQTTAAMAGDDAD